ncbi:hypothetical protein [Yimella sp. cx-51]|uniref:hypothetical protein n=1 Tax=Yimella sp. cx-51 TaxID=2770551 RepID=UPI00165DD21E|nr:hypothetical protein [Yimella sp. cx-51]MBC9955549.1 hypothetical protein [Yimella sp. cx-51]QTH37870.1 hypothetical protein J5M86_13650 [Yimella sp. cx-51]
MVIAVTVLSCGSTTVIDTSPVLLMVAPRSPLIESVYLVSCGAPFFGVVIDQAGLSDRRRRPPQQQPDRNASYDP